MNHPGRQVECTIPVLPVRELARSVRFYTEMLGFKLDWGGGDGATRHRLKTTMTLHRHQTQGSCGCSADLHIHDDKSVPIALNSVCRRR
jgi:catechol 2,3-dioxygenase-like lactoylglutathione lyase family enzyme